MYLSTFFQGFCAASRAKTRSNAHALTDDRSASMLMRPGDAGLLHDLAPAGDLGVDERPKRLGRRAVDRDHPDLGELRLDVRRGHDGFPFAMKLVHEVAGLP